MFKTLFQVLYLGIKPLKNLTIAITQKALYETQDLISPNGNPKKCFMIISVTLFSPAHRRGEL